MIERNIVKSLKIKNIYGIDEIELNFKRARALNNISELSEYEIEEQTITHKGHSYMLTPTFIAKNAKGKTSIAKTFALIDILQDFSYISEKFVNIVNKSIIKHLDDLLWNTNDSDSLPNFDEISKWISNFKLEFILDIVRNVKENISKNNQQDSLIELTFSNSKKIEIKILNDAVTIKTLSNKEINLGIWLNSYELDALYQPKILEKMYLSDNKKIDKVSKPARRIKWRKMLSFIEKIIFMQAKNTDIRKKMLIETKTTKSYKINYLIFNDDNSFNKKEFWEKMFKEILTQKTSIDKRFDFYNFYNRNNFKTNIVDDNLKNIVKHLNFSYLDKLLKTIDHNIVSIKQNNKMSIEIYQKNIEIPFSSNVLSFGTIKIIKLISNALNIIENGGMLIIDEIENGLHHSLIKILINLFESENINKSRSQLFVTTHNPIIFGALFNPLNCLLFQNEKIVKLSDLKGRTEFKTSLLLPKNYYNDYLWISLDNDQNSTLSYNDIIDLKMLSESAYERNKSNGK